MGAERGRDGDRDERAAAVIQPAAGPRVAEGADGGQPPEVLLAQACVDLTPRLRRTAEILLAGLIPSRNAAQSTGAGA